MLNAQGKVINCFNFCVNNLVVLYDAAFSKFITSLLGFSDLILVAISIAETCNCSYSLQYMSCCRAIYWFYLLTFSFFPEVHTGE